MDILDHEASEDEAARRDTPLDRLSSHEANVELVNKEKRYRGILAQALSSDEIVRQKWDEWEINIAELTWSEVRLFVHIPRQFGCLLFFFRRILKHPSLLRPCLLQHRKGNRHRDMPVLCVYSLKSWTISIGLEVNSSEERNH